MNQYRNELPQSSGDLFLRQSNANSIAFIAGLRDEISGNTKPIVLNGVIGPRGDAYAPEARLAVAEAEEYDATQIGWLAATEVDMVAALQTCVMLPASRVPFSPESG